nr:N-acetylmuramoyl-L-alanine amidase [Desulforamulus aquiferis]
MVQKIIVIDPGHGGSDPGAVGNNLLEKDLNLDISLKVAARLSSYDAQIRLTRTMIVIYP